MARKIEIDLFDAVVPVSHACSSSPSLVVMALHQLPVTTKMPGLCAVIHAKKCLKSRAFH